MYIANYLQNIKGSYLKIIIKLLHKHLITKCDHKYNLSILNLTQLLRGSNKIIVLAPFMLNKNTSEPLILIDVGQDCFKIVIAFK